MTVHTVYTVERPEPEPVVVRVMRTVLVVLGVLAGVYASQNIDWVAETGYSQEYTTWALGVLGASIGYVAGGMLGRELVRDIEVARRRIAEMKPATSVLGAVGLLIGLVAAYLVSSSLFSYIANPRWLGLLATIVLYVLCAYVGAAILMASGRQFMEQWPRDRGIAADGMPPMLLDTSAVIDGRFVGLARAGVLGGPLRVPRFVLEELHTLADSTDDARRARGRRGLDLLTTVTNGDHAVTVLEADYPELPTVDAKLVRLASLSAGVLVTVDHNLTDVARVQGVSVLNVNEAAEALRPTLLPGDRLSLCVTREGKEPGQGVGHLEDGTMVVVNEAADAVGLEIQVQVTSVLQTASGRMAFGRKAEM